MSKLLILFCFKLFSYDKISSWSRGGCPPSTFEGTVGTRLVHKLIQRLVPMTSLKLFALPSCKRTREGLPWSFLPSHPVKEQGRDYLFTNFCTYLCTNLCTNLKVEGGHPPLLQLLLQSSLFCLSFPWPLLRQTKNLFLNNLFSFAQHVSTIRPWSHASVNWVGFFFWRRP